MNKTSGYSEEKVFVVGSEGITEVIRRRRTVKPKEFSDQTISQEIIDEILEERS